MAVASKVAPNSRVCISHSPVPIRPKLKLALAVGVECVGKKHSYVDAHQERNRTGHSNCS